MHTGTRTIALAGLLGAALACSLVGQSNAADEKSLWTENVADAMKQAAAEKKDLLLDFTGSDWCSWCIKLHDEVFDLEPFKTEAPKKFVLVALDFPRDKSKQSEATIAQNKEWEKKLSPPGFPSIYLTDEKGAPYARTGYQKGGPEKYVAHLNELALVRGKRDTALELAGKSEGAAKAKALDDAMTAVGEDLALGYYNEEVKQIIALDADNKAGLKDKYQQLLNNTEARKLVADMEGEYRGDKPEEFLKKVDEIEARLKPTGEVRLEIFGTRLRVLGAADKNEEALKVAQELRGEKSLTLQQRIQVTLQVAGILRRLDRADEALKIYDELLTGDGAKEERRFLFHFFKAQTLAGAGKMKEAEKSLDDAIAVAPDADTKKNLEEAKEAFKPQPAPEKPAPPPAPDKDEKKEEKKDAAPEKKEAPPEAPKK